MPIFLHFAKTHEVVTGSRFLGRVSIKNRSLWRNIISKTTKWFVNVLLGLSLSDVTTGYKCFGKDVLGKLDLDSIVSKGYAFQIEVAYLLKQKGISIKEIPIFFVERTAGKSKMSGEIMIEGILLIIRLFFCRFQQFFKINNQKKF